MFNNEFEQQQQHLSDDAIDKLRNVIKTKIAGELTIKNTNLERTLQLAGQNPSKTTVENIQTILDETFHTDEYFLDEIESILASFWEDLTDEDIIQLFIESFQLFDPNKQGFLLKNELIDCLTKYGDMPLMKKDFQIMFSMMENVEEFNYEEFVRKLCSKQSRKKKKKLKRKMK